MDSSPGSTLEFIVPPKKPKQDKGLKQRKRGDKLTEESKEKEAEITIETNLPLSRQVSTD